MNKLSKMGSFKSSYNIQKKESRPNISVSNNRSSSVKLNEMVMKAKVIILFWSFNNADNPKADIKS